MNHSNLDSWVEEMRELLTELAAADVGYEPDANQVLPVFTSQAPVPEPLRPFYAACNGVSLPDVFVGYFIDTRERVAAAAARGEPVRIVGFLERPIHVFGTDGGGGRFALDTDDGSIYYLASSGGLEDGRYIAEKDFGRPRRVAGSVSEFFELLKDDVRAFVRGERAHRYLVKENTRN